MITINKPVGLDIISEIPDVPALDLRGKSTDVKPTNVPNGSTFLEIDTGNLFIFDAETSAWLPL